MGKEIWICENFRADGNVTVTAQCAFWHKLQLNKELLYSSIFLKSRKCVRFFPSLFFNTGCLLNIFVQRLIARPKKVI